MVSMSSIWTIRRSATDSKLTGLCGGVARHWGVDPVLVRVGCVLLALSGGIGLVLYLAGWLLIPIEGHTDAPIDDLLGRHVRSWPREAWIAIVAACCILVFAVLGTLTPVSLWPAVIMALIWYFGYYKNRRPQRDGSAGSIAPKNLTQNPPPPPQFFSHPGPPTAFTEAADAWRQRVEEAHRQQTLAYEDVSEPVGPASSLPPFQPFGAPAFDVRSSPVSTSYFDTDRTAYLATPDPVGLYAPPSSTVVAPSAALVRRSQSTSARRLRLVSLVVLGLTLAGLALADNHGVAVPVAAYFGASLLVLGLTLVAAAWFGRARGILAVALLVLLGTIGTSVGGPMAHEQGWGSRTVVYTTAQQLTAGDHQDRGVLKVDLSHLSSSTDTTYTASVDLGSIEVTAPTAMNVVVSWHADNGGLVLDGSKSTFGTDVGGAVSPPIVDPKKKTLTLDLSVDNGVVLVRR
jgi:phage shock protein PspC (stress-responsive transcriptional regulator)